jgi:hypothetical protein
MSLISFVALPACWAITAKLLAMALALSLPAPRGEKAEAWLSRWGVWAFPAVYLLLAFVGISGDASRGAFLFDSRSCLAWRASPGFWSRPSACILCSPW